MTYIKEVHFQNFTLFSDITIPFSKHINVISGETAVGKTNVLKAIYSIGKTVNDIQMSKEDRTKQKDSELLTNKLIGVFRPEDRTIGRLVKRKTGNVGRAICNIRFADGKSAIVEFTNRQTKNVEFDLQLEPEQSRQYVYIPAKEIISSTENFASLYETYHIAFEETYYDLSKLLLLPVKRGPLDRQQKELIQMLEKLMDAKVVLKNNKFSLKTRNIGNIEIGLVAEGYRKIATLIQLIMNNSIGPNTVLLWDEPESNINPKMIPHLTQIFIELARMGVQIFLTTHSFFLQQELSLFSQNQNKKEPKLDINFITLYREGKNEQDIQFEAQSIITELEHNPIQQEFSDLYNREQELFYDDSK
jgi:predicted ATP-dependent endonuclease of OLD family